MVSLDAGGQPAQGNGLKAFKGKVGDAVTHRVPKTVFRDLQEKAANLFPSKPRKFSLEELTKLDEITSSSSPKYSVESRRMVAKLVEFGEIFNETNSVELQEMFLGKKLLDSWGIAVHAQTASAIHQLIGSSASTAKDEAIEKINQETANLVLLIERVLQGDIISKKEYLIGEILAVVQLSEGFRDLTNLLNGETRDIAQLSEGF